MNSVHRKVKDVTPKTISQRTLQGIIRKGVFIHVLDEVSPPRACIASEIDE